MRAHHIATAMLMAIILPLSGQTKPNPAFSIGSTFERAWMTSASGTVADSAGNPIAGATVDLSSSRGARTATAKTNDQGKFSVTMAVDSAASLDPTVTYTLAVRAIGFVPWNKEFAARTIPRPPGVSVVMHRGTIVTSGNASIPSVRVINSSSLGSRDALTFTMGYGRLVVVGADIPKPSYEVTETPPVSAGRNCSLTGTETTSSELRISTGVFDSTCKNLVARLEVPRNLKFLKLIMRAGTITVGHFDGELSIQSERGNVYLDQISGPATVEARNGEIRATIAHLPAVGQPGLDFLGRNGDISVTLPGDAKTNLSLEVHGGEVSSDFSANPGTTYVKYFLADSVTFYFGRGQSFGSRPDLTAPMRYLSQVNGGGTPIKLVALKGNIVVVRGGNLGH